MSERSARVAALLVTWALSLAYLARFADRGWVPADEGMIGQTAERVLRGEVPHRDYQESYTGGLTYLHALGFRLLGVRLLSLRFVLLALAAAFVPAFFAIALRLAPPLVAGLVTLLAVAWSFPNYFASLPSWYVLVFATWGTLALLRFVETGRRRWLVLAGVWGGIAMLVIVVGIYFVAAGVLFLFYREQQTRGEAESAVRETASRFLFVTAGACLAFLGLLAWLLHRRFGPSEILDFFLPAAALCALLVRGESETGVGSIGFRARRLLSLLAPFGLGVAVPVLLFLIPFAAANALPDLFRGVFVAPQRRLHGASMSPPLPETLLASAPYALLLIRRRGPTLGRVRGAFVTALVAAVLGGVLLASAETAVYRAVWLSARSLAVVATLIGCVILARPEGARSRGAMERQRLFLLLDVSALVSLMQFPFAAPIYFCYVAPLVVLALLAIVRARREAPAALHLAVVGFYLLFAVFRTNTGYIWQLGRRYVAYRAESRLDLPRGGLRVPAADKRDYEDLIHLVQEKGRGPDIYAAPDAPEVYFLSGLGNPTRILYDFLSEPASPPGRFPSLLQARGVTVMVINRAPDFSPPMPAELARALEEDFPCGREIGRFTVRWKQ